jgi:hypothetical protein
LIALAKRAEELELLEEEKSGSIARMDEIKTL